MCRVSRPSHKAGRIQGTLEVMGDGMRSADDLDKELQFHLDERVADLVARGTPLEEARRLARLEFGGPVQIREAIRDQSAWSLWDGLVQDLRLAVRTLRATPIVTVVAVREPRARRRRRTGRPGDRVLGQ
jgi:hypothetical protein